LYQIKDRNNLHKPQALPDPKLEEAVAMLKSVRRSEYSPSNYLEEGKLPIEVNFEHYAKLGQRGFRRS